MLGAGTKTATTTSDPQTRCLDLTRLISRVGRGPLTGVDRVELAYLEFFTSHSDPFFVLVRTVLGYVLLDRKGAHEVLVRIKGEKPWGPVDLVGRFSRKAHPMKRRAEADLRRLCVDRCRRRRLSFMLSRMFSDGCTYLNVGHSNLSNRVLQAWKTISNCKISVLIHDTIPLDFPQFQREGSVAKFEGRMRRVSTYADQILCISAETERRVQHWFEQWGHDVPSSVAHLGVDVPQIVPNKIPENLRLQKPYFVSVGTIEPRKNHALLLDIWDELATQPDPPILIIAGARGWNNKRVFDRLDDAPSYVIEASNLTDDELGALVSNATGMLFPTFAEGFGLPPAEALALNIPVICSDLPVFHEILGNNPIYADSNDMYLWKQSILRLREQGRAEQARTVGTNTLFEVPTWENHFNLVLKVT